MSNNNTAREETIDQVVPQDLLQAIREGECILFVGAGLSKEAGYPDGRELARKLRSEISDARFQPEEDASLSEVAQAFEASRSYSRAELVMAIKKALTLPHHWSPDKRTLKLIAHIPYLNKRIITTNWDSLIEDTIREEMEVRPAVVIQDLDIGKVAGSAYVVYKIHGSLDKEETVVVTDLDYRRIYGELFEPKSLLMAHIRALLSGNKVIYVGYSLQDEDFQELLTQIQSALRDKTGYQGSQQYAIIPRFDMSETEYKKKQKAWARKHVQIIDCTAREFFEEVYQQTSEFKNREREINLLLESRNPYIEIVGNVGSGKTRLLREIGVRYRQELRWPNTVFVDLEQTSDLLTDIADGLGDSSLNTPAKIQAFARTNGLLILLDSIDRVDPDRLKILCEGFIPKVIDPQHRRLSRIIWATRYSISNYLPFSVKSNLLSLALSMFSENVTAEMVGEFANVMIGKKLEDLEAQLFAHEILELVGYGHPGLIKETLHVLKKEPGLRFSIAYLQSREGKGDVLQAMLDIITKSLPADRDIREALQKTMCVPRGIHRGVLDYLAKYNCLVLTGRSADDYGCKPY